MEKPNELLMALNQIESFLCGCLLLFAEEMFFPVARVIFDSPIYHWANLCLAALAASMIFAALAWKLSRWVQAQILVQFTVNKLVLCYLIAAIMWAAYVPVPKK